jgi:hypothetical protein
MKPWIDDSNNRDNMLFSIAEGIRKSDFFIVFLTANFNDKIMRGHEEKEWCFRELNYAAYKLSPKNVIVVVLEEKMTRKSNWADVLQFLFASDVYFDLSTAAKHGSGWDYSKTEAWPKLLMKLQQSEVLAKHADNKWICRDIFVFLSFSLFLLFCAVGISFSLSHEKNVLTDDVVSVLLID